MKFSNKKKIILGSIIGVLIGTLMSVSYAFFTYNRTGLNNKLIVGDIYMRYKEDNTLTIEEAMPRSGPIENKYFEFTIEGKNTTEDKDIWYDISLTHGEAPTIDKVTKNENQRIKDKFLRFKLVEVENNVESEPLLNNKKYGNLNNWRIYVDKIGYGQEISKTYRLYMWIDNSVKMGNTSDADYSLSAWNDLFASIKVNVTGDFNEKDISMNMMNKFPEEITSVKNSIKEVYFIEETTENINTRYNAATTSADLTYNNNGSVKGWIEGDKLYVASDGEIYLPTNSAALFIGFSNVNKINFNNVNTSRVENMNAMFGFCSKLSNLDLSSFDTSNVTDMSNVFMNCSELQSIDLSGKGGNKLTTVNNIFTGCSKLKNVNMSEFNFGTSFSAYGMFIHASSLENFNLNGANLSQAISLQGAFNGMNKLKVIDLSNIILNSSITSTAGMFINDNNLTTIYVSNVWNMNNITNSEDMFTNCTSLVGGNGTHYSDDNPKDKTMAIIDGTNGQPGYFTDIKDKPNN